MRLYDVVAINEKTGTVTKLNGEPVTHGHGVNWLKAMTPHPDIRRQLQEAQPRKEPFCVQCKPCGHKWVAAYTPMDLVIMGQMLISMHCPMCGADSDAIFLDD